MTEDFASSYAQMIERGIKFVEHPRKESYGTVAVFQDIYGNRWDLIQSSIGAATGATESRASKSR